MELFIDSALFLGRGRSRGNRSGGRRGVSGPRGRGVWRRSFY